MGELRHSSTGRDSVWAPIMEKAYAESGIQAAFGVCGERLAGLSKSEYFNPIDIAPYFALAGDTNQTFVWLEKAYRERSPTIHLMGLPAYDPYRSDPRFVDLVKRIGFPKPGFFYQN